MKLTKKDANIFFKEIFNPKKPNKKLIKASEKYLKQKL